MDERGTIAAGDEQGLVVLELGELYLCSVQHPIVVLVVLLSDGVEKLVVSAFLVDMHDCSLVLPGGDDKKDIVAHPAPQAPSIRAHSLAFDAFLLSATAFQPSAGLYCVLSKSVTPKSLKKHETVGLLK